MAVPTFTGTVALVVTVYITHVTCSALSGHHAFTLTAEKLRCQEIFILCFVVGRGFLCFCHTLLYFIKQFFRNDGRNSAGNNRVPVRILADILSVVEHSCDAVDADLSVPFCSDTGNVQFICYFPHGLSGGVMPEGIQYGRSGDRIDLKVLCRIDNISDW